MRETFREIRLSPANKARLSMINSIIKEYQAQRYKLTLRQLYYQLVSRDVIPNRVEEYNKLSKLLKEGRMAGIVDWDAIEDRLRVPDTPAAWDSPEDIMDTVIWQYKQPRQEGQETYMEVWVEKDALSGVLSRVTYKYHVPIVVNRGYSSVSAMYDSYNRFKKAIRKGQKAVVLYLGDFDPSGVDMIRDVYERPVEMLAATVNDWGYSAYDAWVNNEHNGDEADAADYLRDKYWDEEQYPHAFEIIDKEDSEDGKKHLQFDPIRAWIYEMVEVVSIALTREQINQYKPPANPAKTTDPRSGKFISEHGSKSWEVDALKPEVLDRILTDAIVSRMDMDKYEEVLRQEKIGQIKLRKAKLSLSDIDVDDEDLEDDDENDEDDE
jgi:hypothetical protein